MLMYKQSTWYYTTGGQHILPAKFKMRRPITDFYKKPLKNVVLLKIKLKKKSFISKINSW